MFQSKTLFVVGAGASQEVGLPTGRGLRETIASKVEFEFDSGHLERGDRNIWMALDLHVEQLRREFPPRVLSTQQELENCFNAGRHIASAMPQALSIDNFIDAQQNEKVEVCGGPPPWLVPRASLVS